MKKKVLSLIVAAVVCVMNVLPVCAATTYADQHGVQYDQALPMGVPMAVEIHDVDGNPMNVSGVTIPIKPEIGCYSSVSGVVSGATILPSTVPNYYDVQVVLDIYQNVYYEYDFNSYYGDTFGLHWMWKAINLVDLDTGVPLLVNDDGQQSFTQSGVNTFYHSCVREEFSEVDEWKLVVDLPSSQIYQKTFLSRFTYRISVPNTVDISSLAFYQNKLGRTVYNASELGDGIYEASDYAPFLEGRNASDYAVVKLATFIK